jgi:methyltransferase-like protein/SAM-dependent methyltransferase
MANANTDTPYDLVPYDSNPFPQSCPDRMATVATLLGVKYRPVERCRVLEIGCAAGGNLIPLALAYPQCSFRGIDLSARQVADGQRIVAELGLKNIDLTHLSIMDVGPDFGAFDYIICHGVYSWVPTQVQDKILDICKRNLALNGIAYVSYNTYPGWHMRGMIRDMMRFHTKFAFAAEPTYRTRQARNLLDFLANSVAADNTPYSLLLRSEVESLRKCADWYLFHEHLEEVNDPIYFHQFAERLQAKDLRYLGETNISAMLPSNLPPAVESVLKMLSFDLIHMEQYMDFVRNRMFRQSLVCHHQQEPDYSLRPERLVNLYVSSALRPARAEADLASNDLVDFVGPDTKAMHTADPMLKTAMSYLGEIWPRAVSFSEVLSVARGRLKLPSQPDKERQVQDSHALGQCLLGGYTSGSRFVELSTQPSLFTLEIHECPLASPLARLQARSANQVTNLRHETVPIGHFERHMLPLVDGKNDKAALGTALRQKVVSGDLVVEAEGQPVTDENKLKEILHEAIDKHLNQFARSALLMG